MEIPEAARPKLAGNCALSKSLRLQLLGNEQSHDILDDAIIDFFFLFARFPETHASNVFLISS